MSAPPYGLKLAACRGRFFQVLNPRFPATVGNDPLRRRVVSIILGEEVESQSEWDAEKWRTATDEVEKVHPQRWPIILAEAEASLPVVYNAERVEELRAELQESRDERIALNWRDADRLAEVYAHALAADANARAELSAAAKLIGLKLKAAERWVMASRLIAAEVRALFCDLSWSVFEVAASAWHDDEEPSAAVVRDRLEMASDNGWNGPGLALHIFGPKQRDPVHPSRRMLERICERAPDAAKQIRSLWPELDALYSVAARKVAP